MICTSHWNAGTAFSRLAWLRSLDCILQNPAFSEITCDCYTLHRTEQSVLSVHQANNDTPTKPFLLLPLPNKNSNYTPKNGAGPKCPAPVSSSCLNFDFKFRFSSSYPLRTHPIKNIPNASRQANLDVHSCSVFLLH